MFNSLKSFDYEYKNDLAYAYDAVSYFYCLKKNNSAMLS